ncbi:hypothetical protein HEP_00478800, partial [Hepatocystis sp. ex Piliocolobus tephrosceles]
MLNCNAFTTILVCLFGIAHSLLQGDNNEQHLYLKHRTKSLQNDHKLFKRHTLGWYIDDNTCVLKNKNVCNPSDYEISIENGMSNAFVKVVLVQNGTSSIMSVHTRYTMFSDRGSAVIKFHNIPSLSYNVRIETINKMYNEKYTIGDGCDCGTCLNTKLTIALESMENDIIHRIIIDTSTELLYPHSYFVHGEYLIKKFFNLNQIPNIKTMDNYNYLYNDYKDLVYPCAGLIMVHAEKYKIHYPLYNVNCFYVSLLDLFLKKVISNDYNIENFANKPVLLFFNRMDNA